MTGDMWHGVADGLVARRQVVLVDPPGHGGSQPLTDMFTFGDCARCVVDILDGLGIDRAHFVGNSWGGMIGATFAATYPERIGRAVLMNCTAGRASVRQKVQFAILLRLAQWHGGIGPLLNRPVLKAFLGPTTFRERPDVVAHVRSAVKAVNIASASWAVKSVVPAPTRPASVVGRHHDTGARCRRCGRRDLPAAGSDRDGRCHPRLVGPGARRGGSPCRPGGPRVWSAVSSSSSCSRVNGESSSDAL